MGGAKVSIAIAVIGRDQVLHSSPGGEWPTPEDRNRQKRGQHSWDQCDQPDAEALRLPDPDPDGPDQTFEKHGRAGSPGDQEADPPNARIQVLSVSFGNTRGHRSRKHDPQGPDHARTLSV